MKPANKGTKEAAPFREGDLLRLELKVARRADILWRSAGYCSGKDLIYWLQAENEVLEPHYVSGPAAHAMYSVAR